MLSPLDLPCGNGSTSISDLEMAPILEESSGGIIESMTAEFLNFKLFIQTVTYTFLSVILRNGKNKNGIP